MTSIYKSRSHILIRTGHRDPAEHCHMAAHIILSLKQNMTAVCSGKPFSCRGIMIPPGASHCIHTHGQPALVFLYNSTTRVAAQIREIQILPESACDRICALFSAFEKDGTSRAYASFERSLLAILDLESGCSVTDERILSAMKTIRSGLSEPLSCREIADSVYLSQSRFSHLFRQQVGMTFSAYVICQRLMYAYTKMIEGSSITEAALESGFSSSTHFAETNRRVFGLSASSITKNITFTKVQ